MYNNKKNKGSIMDNAGNTCLVFLQVDHAKKGHCMLCLRKKLETLERVRLQLFLLQIFFPGAKTFFIQCIYQKLFTKQFQI